ncbi:MAG: hypothetical protein EOP86_21325 [Verrucomicrobiaceae bacterium]|nr:MAG: hypothetical protein EOP86_21325 [Verrucomicrobiaceae bacterium]
MKPTLRLAALSSALMIPAAADTVTVRNTEELRSALPGLKSGTVLKIASGDYPGGHWVSNVSNLTVEALDPAQPPHFKGGEQAWHFSRCPQLTLRHLRISGQTGNGLNLDDGGKAGPPVTGVTLESLQVGDIGPQGNHDAIKISGLDNVTVKDCGISGWGGEGIDFVGCHQSRVTGCEFSGKPGFSAGAGIQMKGGSSGIVVEKCRFNNAGGRPLNLGGSTGAPFYRPMGARYEARDLTVRGCVIEGGDTAAAFVGVDGAEFSNNTILYPRKWVFRILQETTAEGFPPCRNVVIKNNRIVLRRSEVRTDINIGSGTAPESFRFEGNHWFAEDEPARSRPVLPSAETGGRYGADPRAGAAPAGSPDGAPLKNP